MTHTLSFHQNSLGRPETRCRRRRRCRCRCRCHHQISPLQHLTSDHLAASARLFVNKTSADHHAGEVGWLARNGETLQSWSNLCGQDRSPSWSCCSNDASRYIGICCTGVFPSRNSTISHHPGTFPTAGTVSGSSWRNFAVGDRGNTHHNQVQCGEGGLEISAVWSLELKENERNARWGGEQQKADRIIKWVPRSRARDSRILLRRQSKGAMISSNECMVLLPQNHNVPMQKNLRCFPSVDWGWRHMMFFP